MSDRLARRLSAMTGITLASAVAVWWLGGTRLALDSGADASRHAADALLALWLARSMVLALAGVRVAALHGWRPGIWSALAVMAPSWPLVVLAWSASTSPLASVAVAEGLLLAGSVVLPLVGSGLHRVLPQTALVEPLATVLGIALAAALWTTRGSWAAALL